jgi:hypothetical protein
MKRIHADVVHHVRKFTKRRALGARESHEQLVPALIVVALLAVAVAAIIGNDVPVLSGGWPVVSPTSTPSPRLYMVGQTADQGSYLLEVTKLQIDPTGAPPFVPGNGNEYYVLGLRIKNLSAKPMQLAPVVQTYLRDQSGTSYQLAPAALENPFAAGPLAPGEERAGQLSYDVQKTATDMRFLFDTGLPDVPTTTVQLSQ